MPATWRTVRVFISSTFRDMHAERDHLVEVVFPALRERLEKHRIHLVDIDLRWGVTAEQADNDMVLDLCLEQIDGCRPFFVGILGQRYGWVPAEFPDPAVKKFGWIQGMTGKSITELEILHGVLNNPAMHEHAVFLFRQPECLTDVPENIRREVYEDEHSEQLAIVKQQITAYCTEHGAPLCEYPCRWDATAGRLTGLEQFGEYVEQGLWAAIAREHPEITEEAAPPAPAGTEDWLPEEQDYHERFIESRLRVYVGRERIHGRLTSYLESDSTQPMLLVGGSGTGKSAILGKQWQDWLQGHPDDFVLPHFVGASPSSTNLRLVLRRFCLALRNRFGLTDQDVPEEIEKLPGAFRSFLDAVPEGQRAVILIDAVNQMDEFGGAQDMHWLPTAFPPHVKIIVSCIEEQDRPQRALAALRARKTLEEEVKPLTHEERFEIVHAVPSLSAKTLDAKQIGLLLDNPATQNPLYLTVALEELRGFGSFEKLNEKVLSFPRIEGEPGVTALFTQVIERLEQRVSSDVVRQTLCLIAASRMGLSERELADILAHKSKTAENQCGDPTAIGGVGKGPGADSTLAGERWTEMQVLLRQLRLYLLRRGPYLDFYHRNLFKAVRERYLRSAESDRTVHTELVAYFTEQGYKNRRTLQELPYHQIHAEMWDQPEFSLTDLTFVQAKFASGMGHELNNDYEGALSVLPETKDERERRRANQAKLEEYARKLIDCTRLRSEVRVRYECDPDSHPLPPVDEFRLPVPPDSRSSGSDLTEVNGQSRSSLYVSELKAFAHFTSTYHHLLAESPFETIPLARNYAADGPLATAGELAANTLSTPWVARDPRPPAPPSTAACLRTLVGHTGQVIAVTLTADGRRAVSMGNDKTIRVWNVETGECVQVLEIKGCTPEGHTIGTHDVALAMDGRRAVTADWFYILRVWDLDSGSCLHTLKGHTDEVNGVAVTVDGRWAVSASDDKTLRVWDVERGRCLRTLEGHDSAVNTVAMTPSGQRAVSTSYDELRVWDVETGQCLGCHTYPFRLSSVAMTVDGRLVVSACEDEKIRFLDVETGKQLHTLEDESGSNAVALTADGRRAVSANRHRELRVWDLETGQCLRTLEGHTDTVLSVAVTFDGRRAVSAGAGKALRVWDLDNDSCSRKAGGHLDRVHALAVASGGRCVVSGGCDGLRVWDADSGSCSQDLLLYGTFRSHADCLRGIHAPRVVALTPDGRTAISVAGKFALVWDVQTGRCLSKLEGHEQLVWAVGIAPDGQLAVSVSADKTLRIWSVQNALCLHVLEEDSVAMDCATDVVLTSDGRFAVCSGRESTSGLYVWDLKTFQLHYLNGAPSQTGRLVGVTADGDRIISCRSDFASDSYYLDVWDIKSRVRLHEMDGHTRMVSHAAMSNDGRTVISGDLDGGIRVWDIDSGLCLHVFQLEGQTTEDGRDVDAITQTTVPAAVALTADRCLAAVADHNGVVSVWEVTTGRQIATYRSSAKIESLVWALPDAEHPLHESRIVCSDEEGQLHFLTIRNFQHSCCAKEEGAESSDVAETKRADGGRSAPQRHAPAAPSPRAEPGKWYYSLDGKTGHGPVTESRLKTLIRSGKLKRTSKVSRDGKKWHPASKLRGVKWAKSGERTQCAPFSDAKAVFQPFDVIENSIGTKLVLIPAGEFSMGALGPFWERVLFGEVRRHEVKITKPFFFGIFPVTQGEYEEVIGWNPSVFLGEARRPVENVSWYDAVAFCNRLSEREGLPPYYEIHEEMLSILNSPPEIRGMCDRSHKIEGKIVSILHGTGYRLPTEAEWEYACRAGTTTRWFFGDNESQIGEYAWYVKNSGLEMHPVGQKKPNPWGLYDMYGSVWEFCWDWWDTPYKPEPFKQWLLKDPIGPKSGSKRVQRGGATNVDTFSLCSVSWDCRDPIYGGSDTGFRVCRTYQVFT